MATSDVAVEDFTGDDEVQSSQPPPRTESAVTTKIPLGNLSKNAVSRGSALGLLSKTLSKMKSSNRATADCVLCFSSTAYTYNEDEEFAELDVLRIGNLTEALSCSWKTKKGAPAYSFK